MERIIPERLDYCFEFVFSHKIPEDPGEWEMQWTV